MLALYTVKMPSNPNGWTGHGCVECGDVPTLCVVDEERGCIIVVRSTMATTGYRLALYCEAHAPTA